MNNYDLYFKFVTISSLNPFDAYLELKNFKKEYKQTDFYKKTKMSINRAYKMFLTTVPIQLAAKITELTDVSTLSTKISDVLNSVDEDAINNVFDKFVNAFDINKLQDEKGDLKILLNQLKNLN